jgi:hypothetical protein
MALEEDLRKVERSVEEVLTHAEAFLKAELEQEVPDSRISSWWVEVHSNSTMLLMALQKLRNYYTNYTKVAEASLNKKTGGIK